MHGILNISRYQWCPRRAVIQFIGGLALAAGLIGANGPAQAAGAVCTSDVTLTNADFSITGGQDSDVDLVNKVVKISADPGGAENQDSIAELGIRFTAAESLAADVTLGGIFAVGRLRGSNNIGFGSIKVDAIVRDLTDDVELARTTVIDNSENGSPFQTTIEVVNTLPTAQPVTFMVNLIDGHEYAALIRVEVEAQGFLGLSDFDGGGAQDGVHLSAIEIKLDLEDDDGDGLPNLWETDGIDIDCDPSNGIDLDLPAMGANPNHKDLFIEVDWMPGAVPTQATIKALREVFAEAPVEAAGVANPDGLKGIDLRIDAGNLTDPMGEEDGAGINTCGDGVDNNADGLTDADDPDCLVGDLPFSSLAGGANLGDGQAIPVSNISDLGSDNDGDGTPEFYEARQNNYNSILRSKAIRYSISAVVVGSLGGEAELGGNDFVVFQLNEMPGCAPATGFPIGANAGVWLHELGHTFGFNHDGATPMNRNFTPNYVSSVNNLYTFGIIQNQNATSQDFDFDGVPDCRILDYSPPRVPNGRGVAPLPDLNENGGLNESVRLDPTDGANQFSFFQPPAGQFIQWPLNARPDYDGDGMTNGNNLMVNLNRDFDSNGNPRFELLIGANDWDSMVMDLRGFEDSDDGPKSNLGQLVVDDAHEFLEIYRQQLTTKLELTKEVISDFVVAGQELSFRLTVTNRGPNPGRDIEIRDRLPEEVTVLQLPNDCELTAPRDVLCKVSELRVEDKREFDLRTKLRADLDCGEAQFKSIANKAEISGFAGYQKGGASQVVQEFPVLCINFEYTAKIVCGVQGETDEEPLGRGHYSTSVNIHNPNDETVSFFKKLALTVPPRRQVPGRITPLAIDQLNYDGALKADCRAIRAALGSRLTTPFFEGFLVVQSPRSLDVTAVYTVTTPQTNMHVEVVPERDRRKLKTPPSDDKPKRRPDLTPKKFSCVPPRPGQGNRPRAVEIFVENIGEGTAGPSVTRVTFSGRAEPVDVTLESLSAGVTGETEHAIPRSCPTDCRFTAVVDHPDSIDEIREDNNVLEGSCLPLPG